MILADTSVWIDHLRHGEPPLASALMLGSVRMHSLVLGELACGSLAERGLRIAQWRAMPRVASVTDTQALAFIEWHRLMNHGLSFIDIHLLAACAASSQALRLWTRDRRLADAASELGLCWMP